MRVVIIIDFCKKNKYHPFWNTSRVQFISLFLWMYISFRNCWLWQYQKSFHTYMYLGAEGEKGWNKVATLMMTYLSDKGYPNVITQLDLFIIMDNFSGQNKNKYVLRLLAYLTMNTHFERVQNCISCCRSYQKHSRQTIQLIGNRLQKWKYLFLVQIDQSMK